MLISAVQKTCGPGTHGGAPTVLPLGCIFQAVAVAVFLVSQAQGHINQRAMKLPLTWFRCTT